MQCTKCRLQLDKFKYDRCCLDCGMLMECLKYESACTQMMRCEYARKVAGYDKEACCIGA